MVNVAFFGRPGEFSSDVLRAVAAEHRVVALIWPTEQRQSLVRAAARSAFRFLTRRRNPLAAFAKANDVPVCRPRARDDGAISQLLTAARPDLICIAGFPWVLPATLLYAAPLGVVNLHGSLLPRHRGLLPLFWIYYHDDRETGVTVHWADAGADTGDIIEQDRYTLPRGFPVSELNRLNAQHGGRLMRSCIGRIAEGSAPRLRQDETQATTAPGVHPGTPMVRFDEWDVERVWHFLAGLYPWFQEPLRDTGGALVRYRHVDEYIRSEHARRPGTVDPHQGRWTLYCRGGTVTLRP